MSGHDLASEVLQVRDQCVGDPLRAAPGKRPAVGVAEEPEHEPERRAARRLERQHGVRRQPGEQAAGTLAGEAGAGHAGGGTQRAQAEPRGEQRVARRPQRAEEIGEQLVRAGGERFEELRPRTAVPVQAGRGGRDGGCCPTAPGTLEHGGRRIVERVRDRGGWLHELQPVPRQRQLAQERRAGHERVDRRADVVNEARLGQLRRPRAAARRVGALQHQHRQAGLRQDDRRRQPVGAGADDDGVPACRDY